MKNIKLVVILLIAYGGLNSCLTTLSPRNHYFVTSDNTEKDNPKLLIFSTPRHKNYVVTNISMDAQVFIKSSVFENPDEFYLMNKEDFFEKEAKQYILDAKDGKFYKTDKYKSITLRIINRATEKILKYIIVEK